jgi:HK97 family phage prohead protease
MSDVERFYAVAPIEMVDVRDNEAQGTWTMSGYAAVFGHKAEMYSDKFVRATVEIHPDAFTRVFAEQRFDQPAGAVHFNRGHDMNTSVAATDVPAGQPGSLRLGPIDKNGLPFLAKVSKDDPDGIALASKMRSGVVRQASFAFTTSGNEFSLVENDDGPDEENRLIMEISHLYDVCACTQGRFSQTISGLQQYAKLLGQPAQGDHHHQPVLGEGNNISRATGDGAAVTPLEWPDGIAEQASLHRPLFAVDVTERK